MSTTRAIVIGAGASGLLAAGRAAETGADVLLIEKTARLGNKIRLTGQGRCNLTHTGEIADFIPRYNDGRFLYSAFNHFFRGDLLELLSRYGLKTKTEIDGRIFPSTGDAREVVEALESYAQANGVTIQTGTIAERILVESGRAVGVLTEKDTFYADTVILAAGGCSYPATGSAGDGYRMAETAGHTIVSLRPALVPLKVPDPRLVKEMQGVSLSGARIAAFQRQAQDVDISMMPERDYGRGTYGKKAPPPVIESRTGDVIFTHFGLSGPVVLLISLDVVDALEKGPVSVAIDMKPESSTYQLRRELQAAFDRTGKRNLGNLLEEFAPGKMAGVLVKLSGIPPEKQGHEITAGEKGNLLGLLKCLKFDIEGPLALAAATVTAGGVSLREVDPRTLESRLIKGLYFCGEVLDMDGESGGYNLQAAFSTGYLAGEKAAT